jgi:hypothetical protein
MAVPLLFEESHGFERQIGGVGILELSRELAQR